MLGPVYNAQHSRPSVAGGLFALGVGLMTMAWLWMNYFWVRRNQTKASVYTVYNLIWITLIACVFIGLGVFELICAGIRN